MTRQCSHTVALRVCWTLAPTEFKGLIFHLFRAIMNVLFSNYEEANQNSKNIFQETTFINILK